MSYLSLGYKSLAHFQAQRYEQALQAVEQALMLYPYMFSLKDKAVYCEKLGRHEDARDAVRRLRVAVPSLTLADIERSNALVFAPETATDMNATFRKVWTETQG
jgi:tetratricopeptide (TPR) repeat protein